MDPTRTDRPVAAEYDIARRETRDGDNEVISGQPDTGDTRGVGDGERRATANNPERSTDARQVATPDYHRSPVTADGRTAPSELTEVNCSVECARTPDEWAGDTNALVTETTNRTQQVTGQNLARKHAPETRQENGQVKHMRSRRKRQVD